MSRSNILCCLLATLLIFPLITLAQDTLAGWTFPSGQPADTLANYHIPSNVASYVRTAGEVSGLTTFTNGATTYAATASGWDNGMLSKCWMIQISTAGYQNLKMSSKQRSGGNNPGPRDFIVQCKIGMNGNWIDIAGTNLVLAGDWSAELIDIPLPNACENLQETLYLRWLMTSNINSQGGTIAPEGISKTDDIFIKGDVLTGIPGLNSPLSFNIYPNPCSEMLNVSSFENNYTIRILDIRGKELLFFSNSPCLSHLDLSDIPNGIYLIQILNKEGFSSINKFIKTKSN